MPYERRKRLPVTDLNVALSRQSEGLSDAQAARNLKASVLAQLGNPEPNDIILELSDETYYLPRRSWTTRWWWDTVLDQPLGALRDVSYQLFCGDEILESAFEQRPDKLCVARQLAELMRLPVQEVLSDFDAITNGSKWREQGITPREIRSFCVWRQAPMFYVDCQGRLLDKFEPAIKEQRAVAFTSWNGHAFFYKSARTVARCEPIGDRAQAKYRARGRQAKRRSSITGGSGRARSAAATSTPRTWSSPEGAPGREALPQGGHAEHERVAVPSPEIARRRGLRHLRLPRGPGRAAGLDGPAGAPYRGQRLAGAASEVFLHLLKARRDHQCKLCAAPITAATCELDHIVPVHQSFSAQAQNLQALCLECHRNKTALEFSHATTLESRFSRRAYERPGCPSHKPERICYGIDVVRCRKNALAHSKFPAPIFCPKDNMEQAREGHLADLTYVKLPEDGRRATFPRLPYVGEGWYAKPAAAYMLEKGIATWSDFAWSLDATAHVDQESVTQALQQMEAAWPEEEHYAKLSVNASSGSGRATWTSSTPSNHQFDGSGCQHRSCSWTPPAGCTGTTST